MNNASVVYIKLAFCTLMTLLSLLPNNAMQC